MLTTLVLEYVINMKDVVGAMPRFIFNSDCVPSNEAVCSASAQAYLPNPLD